MEQRIQFSVIMSVYQGDQVENFIRALESITARQSVQPDEIVLVLDGALPEKLNNAVKRCSENMDFVKLIPVETNQGLGTAMRIASEHAAYDWLARMDADDIAVPDRFEQQVKYIETHPEVDIVGGDIAEFVNEEEITGYRVVPTEHEGLKEYIKSRCPFNHMTVMMRKAALEKAGGYLDWPMNEDYYLWIRMLLAGCRFGNTGTTLVRVRTDENWQERRGGAAYFKSEIGIQNYMLEQQLIGRMRWSVNCMKRLLMERLFPKKVRKFVYLHFARKGQHE